MAHSYRRDVLRFFTDRPGQVVYVDDVANALDLTHTQVANCMYQMRRRHEVLEQQFEVLVRGNAWRYRPTADQPRPVNGVPQTVSTTVEPTTQTTVPAIAATTTATTRTPRVANVDVDTDVDTPRLFEEVGTIGKDVVVRDEDEKIYRLIPIK